MAGGLETSLESVFCRVAPRGSEKSGDLPGFDSAQPELPLGLADSSLASAGPGTASGGLPRLGQSQDYSGATSVPRVPTEGGTLQVMKDQGPTR